MHLVTYGCMVDVFKGVRQSFGRSTAWLRAKELNGVEVLNRSAQYQQNAGKLHRL
ncbi:hypothetical protein PMIT1313_00030 [Prochlorococcus marinus str. MIT 1313]|uniref:hypothetical protein n=1 Tax=Prochlorococcus sp. MIT 1318 TaxID=3082531 RepID=UPI0007BB2398|nr:hypothetical protein PMIT1313_00030 [Prochlorococcus marinus str. MIT 1313]KZR75205.1 hypothetical protein PMIT1318_00290 [Prochlorococcus marinus str. MIT 1318]